MAKKSASNRSRPAPQGAKGAARKPQQTPDRTSTATLVRPAGATGVVEVTEAPAATPSAANIVAEPATQQAKPAAPAAQPKPATVKSAPVKPASTATRPAEPKVATAKPATPKSAAPAAKLAAKLAAKPASQPAAKPASHPAAKPASHPAAKPAPARPASVPTREQNIRMARARATARARQANLISAEHYAYVLGDLKLVVTLAVSAFVILIALAFILPH